VVILEGVIVEEPFQLLIDDPLIRTFHASVAARGAVPNELVAAEVLQ
jgi:hypothetical protein